MIRAAHRKKQRTAPRPQPSTVASAGFLLLLTSISAFDMAPEEVAETYRLRWQIELAFKRLKSGLGIDALPARDRELARSWLAAHFILGLIIDEAVSDTFACDPSLQPRSGTQLSLWRMQVFLRNLLLTAIIGMSRLSRIEHVLAEVTKYLTEPPDEGSRNSPRCVSSPHSDRPKSGAVWLKVVDKRRSAMPPSSWLNVPWPLPSPQDQLCARSRSGSSGLFNEEPVSTYSTSVVAPAGGRLIVKRDRRIGGAKAGSRRVRHDVSAWSFRNDR